MTSGFLPEAQPSYNQLYKQYVLKHGTKISFKDWLQVHKKKENIIKNDIASHPRETVQKTPFAEERHMNVDGGPETQVDPKVEPFRLMGMTVGQLTATVVIVAGVTFAIVKTVAYYKNKNKAAKV